MECEYFDEKNEVELRREKEFLKLLVEILNTFVEYKLVIRPFSFASVKLKLVKLQAFP